MKRKLKEIGIYNYQALILVLLPTETEPSIGKLVDVKFIYGHRQAGRRAERIQKKSEFRI